jgi:hypothetical protein
MSRIRVVRPEGARARTTDPETSHAAAESITEVTRRRSQLDVLQILLDHGALTDQEIEIIHRSLVGSWAHGGWQIKHQSPSGLRSRRSELVKEHGLVRDSGKRRPSRTSTRNMIVWEAT